MSLLVRAYFHALGGRALHGFRRCCERPVEAQHRVLTGILRANAASVYGTAHGFERIDSYAAFRDRVPINAYDDLKPYIDAALHGARGQLTTDDPVLFATTSGTTGAPKYIPVTATSRRTKAQLMRVWLSALHRDHPGSFSGRILTLVSPEVEGRSPAGIPYGAESGHGYRAAPAALQSLYAVPYAVFEIADYDAKYYTLLRLGAATSITLLFTVNPSTVLLLADRLGRHTEAIIRDVRDGTLSAAADVEPDIRAEIEARLAPDPARARFLERAAAARGGRLAPAEVWPDLAAIGTWKGGNVGAYVARFPEYFREDVAVRDVGYYASEVRGSVPLSDDGPAGPLAVGTNFYEFHPADAADPPGPADLLTVADLDAGRQYYVYVTTDAGLYRYTMHDIVAVEGFHHRTPSIRFVQKGKGVTSFTGEKLYETPVLAAVARGLAGYGAPFEYIAALGEMGDGTPRYAFLVEFAVPPTPAEASARLRRVEDALRDLNVEYAGKRDSYRLRPPVLRAIAAGEFERYRMREVARGREDGQFKIVRLTTDAGFGAEFAATADYGLDAAP
ncbi:MAG: GH3 auxin-responsive promoter family protein [Vicinamibacterales bacterium]